MIIIVPPVVIFLAVILGVMAAGLSAGTIVALAIVAGTTVIISLAVCLFIASRMNRSNAPLGQARYTLKAEPVARQDPPTEALYTRDFPAVKDQSPGPLPRSLQPRFTPAEPEYQPTETIKKTSDSWWEQ